MTQPAIIHCAAADLDARDPEYIRNMLPLMWLLTTWATLLAARRLVEGEG